MLIKCKEYAMRRRVEHGHKKGQDDMDVDHVEEDTWGMGGEDGKPHFDCYDTNKVDNILESCFLKRPYMNESQNRV